MGAILRGGSFTFASALGACHSYTSEFGHSSCSSGAAEENELVVPAADEPKANLAVTAASLQTYEAPTASDGTKPVLTFGPSTAEEQQQRRPSAASSSGSGFQYMLEGDRSPPHHRGSGRTDEYRIRFFNYNMANSSHYTSVADLQGPGGRGSFADALLAPMADGRQVDIVFATLVETRVSMTDWVGTFQAQNRGSRLDSVLPQNARRECKKNTKSHVRSFMEGLAASYNGNLKSLLAFNSEDFVEDVAGLLFGRLTEACIAGLPIPNPKKAFMGRTVCEQGGLRLCFVGAHFPIAKLAAALEDVSHGDNLHKAKLEIARTLRKVLTKAGRRKVADDRTAIFVQGDLNSRTLLRSQEAAAELEFEVELDRSRGDRLGLNLELTHDGVAANIVSVQGGLSEMWNLANPSLQLRVGDLVTEANGAGREDGRIVMEECRKDQVLKLKVQRKATDVLLEVLTDEQMQIAIQHELDVPAGRWYEAVTYTSVHELPVTYKFVEHVACSTPKSTHSFNNSDRFSDSHSRWSGQQAAQLTVGDVMNSASVPHRIASASDISEPVSPSFSRPSPGCEPYKRTLDSLGDHRLTSLGIAFNKKDFRAFRFPSCADRVLYWAPDELAERMSFELPRGGYEVNHSQLGSDHRSVSLEAVLRIHPKETATPMTSRFTSEMGSVDEGQRRLDNLMKELNDEPPWQDSGDSDAEGDSPTMNWTTVGMSKEGRKPAQNPEASFGC